MGPALRKAGVAGALALAAMGLARFRAGPAPVAESATPAARTAAALGAASGLDVDAEALQILPDAAGPLGTGAPVSVVFTARPGGQVV